MVDDGGSKHGIDRASPARRMVWAVLAVALAIAGSRLTSAIIAVPSIEWMRMYRADSFPDAAALASFLMRLNVPIPPLLAAAEVLSQQQTGSTALVTVRLYRVALVGSYLLALWLCRRSVVRMIVCAVSGSICLWATSAIHPLNAQVYDVVLPAALLAVFVFLGLARDARPGSPLWWRMLWAALAGFALAFAESSRPFMVLLLPLLLVGGWCVLRLSGRAARVAFLAPVALLSGVWHVHLMRAHGQLVASNYSGFNLHRAWPQVPMPEGSHDANAGQGHEDDRVDLSAPEFGVASRALVRSVFRFALSHPREALAHAIDRVRTFVQPQTSLYGRGPAPSALLTTYRWTVRALLAYAAINAVALLALLGFGRHRGAMALAEPENVLLLLLIPLVFVLACGEAGEEARLMLSVLPMLVALPTAEWRGLVGPPRGTRVPR